MLGSRPMGLPALETRAARRRRIIVPLVILLAAALAAILLMTTGRPATQLRGSGSTLAQPLIEKAAGNFRDAMSADDPERRKQTGADWVVDGSGIDYEPVGSLGGIMRLSAGQSDFAISDYPLSAAELDQRKLAQFPVAVGAVAVVHNLDLPGPTPLRLDAATLAAVYRGEIQRWNDPRIVALNPGTSLPDQAIVPIHRNEGSGSTFGLTRYLEQAPGWQLGAGSVVAWPRGVGKGVDGSRGMIDTVRSTPGSLGYVDGGQAERQQLKLAALANRTGAFTEPDKDAMRAAISGADFSGADRYESGIAGSQDPAAYPMTVGIYALLRHESGSRTNQVLGFLRYLLDESDTAASNLGYLPLPSDAAAAVRASWNQTFSYNR